MTVEMTKLRKDALVWLNIYANQLGHDWRAPAIAESPWNDIVFEWWHEYKKLTIYFGLESIDYIKVWGDDIDSDMEDGIINNSEDFYRLWYWLNTL